MTVELISVRTLDELDRLGQTWDRLAGQAPTFYQSFAEARHMVARDGSRFLVTVARRGEEICGLALFLNYEARQAFTVGERLLFSLPMKGTGLHGSMILGELDAPTIRRMLHLALNEWRFDLFTLGEIEIGSPLDTASHKLRRGLARTRVVRKDSVRWLIDLPDTFGDYLGGLRASTRQSIKSKIKRFERDFTTRTEVVERVDQIDRFLAQGERISRLTYQWQVGQRLEDNAETRERYHRLAAQGRLRCYMTYVDDQPCAFLRGEVSGKLYHYETPGFDPAYEKASPGLVQLMSAVRDLIENTSCEVFDFGPGGDEQGYKARFGNRSFPCRTVQFADVFQPWSLCLLASQAALSSVKDMASALLGQGEWRQKVKKRLRKYGAGHDDVR